VRIETIVRVSDIVLCVLIVFSSFLPWIQFEMVPIRGIDLNELAIENYGADHFMAKMIYVLYAVPVLAIWTIGAVIFGFDKWNRVTKALMLLIVSMTFVMILCFHLSPDYNIVMREGLVISGLCCLLSMWLETVGKSRSRT